MLKEYYEFYLNYSETFLVIVTANKLKYSNKFCESLKNMILEKYSTFIEVLTLSELYRFIKFYQSYPLNFFIVFELF